MFTFKKIALLGAASLAALSMSCSDDGSDDPGGKITGISLGTASSGGVYPINATITAEGEGNYVATVTVSADPNTVSFAPGSAVSGEPATVTLSSLDWKLVPDNCGTATTFSVKLTVRATFGDGGPAEETSETVTGNCIAAVTIPSGFDASGSVTLGGQSGSAGSFLDIDTYNTSTGFAVYTVSTVVGHENDIDLVYDGTNFKTPTGCKAGTTFCSTQLATSTSDAVLYDITALYSLAPNLDVEGLIDLFIDYADEPGGVAGTNSIVAAAGGKYIVLTDKENLALVAVDGAATAAEVKLLVGRASL